MTTVAIICEYNPFHRGHEYQIKKIREQFGEDTAVVCIMSGNYTQRGEFAFMPKTERAKCAILGGADLVLELPFPFSSSSAEYFAKSGVKIADSLGCVDYLSFGSESGDLNALYEAAKIYLGNEFKAAFSSLSDKNLGYPAKCELAYKQVAGESSVEFTPNNILAIEYIKAIIESGSKIMPHTVKRMGASYNSKEIENCVNQSAAAIREAYAISDGSFADHVPEYCIDILKECEARGDLPCSVSNVSSAMISHLRLNSSACGEEYHDAGDGLYNRLQNLSFEVSDVTSLLERSETKNYTRARIKRAMLNIFFGVTSSDVKILPRFTQVLAMNNIGMRILKSARKSELKILTKPSDYGHFDSVELKQKTMSDKADSIFELAKPVPKHGKSALTFTPYVKK